MDMLEKEKIVAFVRENFKKVDVDWTLHRAEGSYSGNDVDERWTREIHLDSGTFKETVRLVRYGHMKSPDVNVQWHIYELKSGWEHLYGHDRIVIPIEKARERFLRTNINDDNEIS